jgi:hypothetical protein
VSTGMLHSPEELHADEDIQRTTASVNYNRPLAKGNWSNMLLWGRNDVNGHFALNSYLAESTLNFAERNYIWGRIENADRTSELALAPGAPLPPDFHEHPYARIQAYSAGYSRDVAQVGKLSVGVGSQVNWYGIPDTLRPTYGNHPVGGVIFLRVRPVRK